MTGALDGIRIIDLTTVILGPWAAQMLGDMGADVIKVETPMGDMTRYNGPRRSDDMGAFYLGANRNKRSVVIDLTTEEGKEALFKLVGTADVFMHNFRPKVCKKLGLEYEKFAEANPDLIYCAAFGFNSEGPMADRPAYDDIIQAASGMTDLLSVIGGEPRFVPTIMADKTSSFHVVSAIMAGLLHRERGGTGQAIEVPMFEGLVDFVMVEHLFGETFEPPIGDMGYTRLLNTSRRPYATKDGYLAVLPYSDQNWQDLFDVAGRDDLKTDIRFSDISQRTKHSQEVYDILGQIVATKTSAEWQSALDARHVPVQVVVTKEELLDHEQLTATGFWQKKEHPTEGTMRYPSPPVQFSKTPSSVRRLQPRLGEHSREVLAEAGYSDAEIDALMASGVSKQFAGQAE
ncbi:MAG: CoA transferase [Alphaproteobacteria bacterium]|nr:CoA transferase [Alphaproteobacteria bacterium]MBT4019058.1 CoA transferase [Alphaproteobacteria bacterium]MBT4966488.1 CoA transferase [Alphaproteobacteria bacterium]MBT5159076.1 CoA transferase [Alphaproteobacteria bacterium]MBT5919918.1 CoA transferase [Alphaproteobacteria bacterium]